MRHEEGSTPAGAKTVWKYPLSESAIEMPYGALILHVARQGAQLCMWAEVDPGAPRVLRRFKVYGTGHTIEATAVPIASLLDGSFVWHVYELLR